MITRADSCRQAGGSACGTAAAAEMRADVTITDPSAAKETTPPTGGGLRSYGVCGLASLPRAHS